MGRSTPLALLLGLTVSATSVGCDGGPATEPEFEPFPQTAPPPSPLLRLTQAQYRNTLRDVFGGDLVLPTQLEPDVDAEGLAAVGASLTTVSPAVSNSTRAPRTMSPSR